MWLKLGVGPLLRGWGKHGLSGPAGSSGRRSDTCWACVRLQKAQIAPVQRQNLELLTWAVPELIAFLEEHKVFPTEKSFSWLSVITDCWLERRQGAKTVDELGVYYVL